MTSNIIYFRPWWKTSAWHAWEAEVICLAQERAKRNWLKRIMQGRQSNV